MHFLYQDKLKRNRSDTGAFFIMIIITVYLTNGTTVTRCLVQLPFAVYVSIGGTVVRYLALLVHCYHTVVPVTFWVLCSCQLWRFSVAFVSSPLSAGCFPGVPHG